jgi:hypothetical protein
MLAVDQFLEHLSFENVHALLHYCLALFAFNNEESISRVEKRRF